MKKRVSIKDPICCFTDFQPDPIFNQLCVTVQHSWMGMNTNYKIETENSLWAKTKDKKKKKKN